MEIEKKSQWTRRKFIQTIGTAVLTTCSMPSEVFSQVPEEEILQQEREARFSKYHHPVVEGKKVPPIAYLHLPFKKDDLAKVTSSNLLYDITEGWMYSDGEKKIHGFSRHFGVDLAVPYGTPVVAPSDGFVMSSYHTFWLKNSDETTKTYQGKPLRFGFGNFVQLYVPEVNRFVQLGHLSEIDNAIPFSEPVLSADDWLPTNHTLTISALSKHPKVVKVERGQPLGKVGFSGLGWGYTDYQPCTQRPVVSDPEKYRSWDEPHVHYEECYRDQETGEKIAQRDPYGIYSTFLDYPTPTRVGKPPQEALFLMDKQGLPQLL